MDFLNHREGFGFLSGYPPVSFTVYSNFTVEIVRGCVTVSSKENFFWISSKNLASGRVNQEQKVQFEIFCTGYKSSPRHWLGMKMQFNTGIQILHQQVSCTHIVNNRFSLRPLLFILNL
jgi:hypothetical protein